MTTDTFRSIESYMLLCMKDSAHDKEHIYRVLYNALEIAKDEEDVDYDVLICACLLHDIAREEQFRDPGICHAQAGGEKACRFLTGHGFDEAFAAKVKHCIQTHRFRKSDPPESIEAKILFDADKLDAAGALGIARTLVYKGIVTEPLYTLLPDGRISAGEDGEPSFFHEYKFKLEKLYSKFYTKKGAELAAKRQKAAVDFYNSLYGEVAESYESGGQELARLLSDTDFGE